MANIIYDILVLALQQCRIPRHHRSFAKTTSASGISAHSLLFKKQVSPRSDACVGLKIRGLPVHSATNSPPDHRTMHLLRVKSRLWKWRERQRTKTRFPFLIIRTTKYRHYRMPIERSKWKTSRCIYQPIPYPNIFSFIKKKKKRGRNFPNRFIFPNHKNMS